MHGDWLICRIRRTPLPVFAGQKRRPPSFDEQFIV
jgi:hypothetical protein